MAGLPSIYWPFIAIGIWHFVTAAGQTKLPICSITSIQLTLCQSKSCPTSARGRFWHEIREFVGTILAGQDRMSAKRGDYILTIGPALASQEWWVCCQPHTNQQGQQKRGGGLIKVVQVLTFKPLPCFFRSNLLAGQLLSLRIRFLRVCGCHVKTASEMHVVPQIVVHCCPLLPIVASCCPFPPRSAMICFTIDCH